MIDLLQFIAESLTLGTLLDNGEELGLRNRVGVQEAVDILQEQVEDLPMGFLEVRGGFFHLWMLLEDIQTGGPKLLIYSILGQA